MIYSYISKPKVDVLTIFEIQPCTTTACSKDWKNFYKYKLKINFNSITKIGENFVHFVEK